MLLDRSTATLTGVSAMNSPATPAGSPKRRRTRCAVTHTVATPSAIWGKSTAHSRKPRSFTLATWIQSASGGLSTETNPAGSNDA